MRRTRSQPIRSAIVSLLAVPLIALTSLWAFNAYGSLGDGIDMANAQAMDTKLIRPAQELITALQHERRLSMASMSEPRAVEPFVLGESRKTTDGKRDHFRASTSEEEFRSVLEGDIQVAMDTLSRDLAGLQTLRAMVGTGKGRDQVYQAYRDLIDSAFAIYRAVSPPDVEIATDASVLTTLGQARELVSRSDAILAGRLGGKLSLWDRKELAKVVGAREFLYHDALPLLPKPDRERYAVFQRGSQYIQLQLMENKAIENRGGVYQTAWDATARDVVAGLKKLEEDTLTGVTERAKDVAMGVLLNLGVAGGLGLVAVVFSLVVAWRVARRLIRESRALADAVGDFTGDQLPQMAELVRKGERVDDAGDPGVRFSVTEIERIFRSFLSAREAVLEAASHEAATMKGVREVFVNLASRNQALLHRQLTLLDKMERDADDPDDLANLFQLDHLATRMRRHAEGLVILSGKTPGRGWRSPVPLMDVVRGAASEVEDYTRVRVMPMPRTALVGPAVADTIHLLADLVENAVQFSPPDTPVEVTGQGVAAGYVLEIEDRGLGLPAEVLDQLNERLAQPPEFNLSDSARLGLFVVARLAQRHGIRITLRMSPYGGTTAVVFLPQELLATVEEPELAPVPRPVLEMATTAPASRPAPEPSEPELHLDLPKRRRKASAAQPQPAASAPPDGPERSPEDLRLRMSAMQQGWQRGRIDSSAQNDDPHEEHP